MYSQPTGDSTDKRCKPAIESIGTAVNTTAFGKDQIGVTRTGKLPVPGLQAPACLHPTQTHDKQDNVESRLEPKRSTSSTGD